MPSAAILAGGRARRFEGLDKSALIVGGQTILARQLSALSQLTDDILLVGSHQPPAIKIANDLVRQIPDRVPDCGPLAGLDAALAACRSETLIAIACDMPFVSARLLGYLAALAEDRPEIQAVVPKTKRGYHPVCAIYTRKCQAAISQHLAEGRLALIELIETLNQSDRGRVQLVTEAELEVFGDPDQLLANVNTPAEYEELAANDRRP